MGSNPILSARSSNDPGNDQRAIAAPSRSAASPSAGGRRQVDQEHLDLARRLAGLFAALSEVEAVALGGSRASEGVGTDDASDIDLYVYTRADIPMLARRRIVERAGGASRVDLGLDYWGAGDEWLHVPTGIHVDAIYFDAGWMEEQVDRVVVRHQASLGCTTCFWHTVRQSIVLQDDRGWLAGLQERSRVDYPEELRRNIVSLNHPVLRDVLPAWANQLEKAARRGDLVSVNHRLAGLLASYFDVVFAVNRRLHPGEKRLLDAAVRTCPRLPVAMADDVTEILRTATTDLAGLPARVGLLLDRLDALLVDEGLAGQG